MRGAVVVNPAPVTCDRSQVTLDDVVAELRLIRQLLEQQRPEVSISRVDRATLTRLLPVLGATYGDEGFTSRDCVEDAEDAAPGLRLVLGQMSVKAIGKLLARAEGKAIDGLMVRRQRTDFRVTVWRVVAC